MPDSDTIEESGQDSARFRFTAETDEGARNLAPDTNVAPVPDGTPAEPTEDDAEPESFPKEVVQDLRKENAKWRQRAQQADHYAHRLHLELVKATGRLADPSDLEFDPDHLDDPDVLTAAVDDLLAAKPHLASRKPVGDIGQGNRGSSAEPFSLLGLLKERA